MPGNCSADRERLKGDDGLGWCTLAIDWPFQVVGVLLKVVAPRDLTVFEWAIKRVLAEFPDGPPTLEELADELGIKAPVFLRETLETLLQAGSVERKGPGQSLDLPDCRLTPLGEKLLREGRAASVPEHHGMRLCFDAITGEHVAQAPKKEPISSPPHPVVEPSRLPARMQEIGLDRVRQLSQLQGEPFHQGDSRIVSASVRVEKGYHFWRTHRIHLGIGREGILKARIDGGSEAQQAWLDEHSWGLEPLKAIASAATAGWANGRCQPRPAPLAADEWLRFADRLVAPASTLTEACGWIASARRELVVHAGWCDSSRIETALKEAASRGVPCYVCGGEPAITDWSPGSPPGFIASAGATGVARPLAIVADRSRGLRVDHVAARTPVGQEIVVEVTAVVRPAAVSGLRQELVAGHLADRPPDDLQPIFARFALTADEALWERGVRLIQDRAHGIEQVRGLHQWGIWAQAVSVDHAPAAGWLGPAVDGWKRQLRASEGHDPALLDAAAGLLTPGEVLAALAEPIALVPVAGDWAPLAELMIHAVEVVKRWPGFDPVRECPAFAHAVKACVGSPGEQGFPAAIAEAAKGLATDPRLSPHRDPCLSLLAAAIPPPQDLVEFLDWIEAHEPLRGQLDGTFPRLAERHAVRLAGLLHAAAVQKQPVVASIREAWSALRLSPEMLTGAMQMARPVAGRRTAGGERADRRTV